MCVVGISKMQILTPFTAIRKPPIRILRHKCITGKEVRQISRCFVVPPRVLTKVVPVPVPLSVPGRFGSKFPVNYGSSVLYGS